MNDKLIFRYRNISEHSILELINDDIVISSLDTFNDPCDATIGFNEIEYHEKLDALKYMNNIISTQIGRNYFDNEKVRDFSHLLYNDHFSLFINNFKRHLLVGCFTRDCKNPVMWSHYCNDRRGFVIGYERNDIEGISNDDKDGQQLHKVDYIEKIFYVTDDIIDAMNKSTKYIGGCAQIDYRIAQVLFNQSLLSKLSSFQNAFLTKSLKWSYEEEERIVRYDSESKGNAHKNIGKCKAKCIIIGDKITEKDRYLLLSVANNKNIDVYEIMTSYNENTFGLLPYPIKKESIVFYLKNGYYDFKVNNFLPFN